MKIKDPPADRTFYVLNYAVLIVFVILVLYPLIYVLSASVSNTKKVASGEVWLWPVGFTPGRTRRSSTTTRSSVGFGNSVYYAVVGAVVATVLTLLAAYPLSRKGLPGQGPDHGGFVFTMMFSGGLISDVPGGGQLGLLNTRWAIILPAAMAVST